MFFNVLQVYSAVTKLQNSEGIAWLQNSEGIARKAGSGRFPHLSHVGKTTSKRSLHRTNIPAPTGLLQTWLHSNPAERLSWLALYAITSLKNWTTGTAALKENFSSMMPTKMHA